MRKTGEILKGQTDTYLLEGDILIQGEVGKANPKHNYLVSVSNDRQYTPSLSFKPLKSFQFKKEALAFIEDLEKNYKNSKSYLTYQLLSGFITREEYKKSMESLNESY